ncbi:unnamed protein product [Rhizoctonia solani]|uniref:Uncharacterized protein n=1 Tax=Rhizoctonia solani TaxID=456999 RepID=A0A8H3HBH9_9AGAM|nr:unnamed protein product [Rhizoctonia solani]
MKDWSEFAGIEICAFVVHETEDEKTRVTREISGGIKGFSNSTRLAKAMDALKEYLEAMGEGPMNNAFPSPWIYPNFTKDGYPCLPKFDGWSVRRMKKLLRAFIKAVFKFQGGVGRMMWQEIKGALHHWIDPQRLPKVNNLVWNDPAFLSKEMVLIWLDFLVACLTGVVPPEQRFQFLRIPAGPTPIHPSDSQETGWEIEEGKPGYILVFENEVTKCHRVGGMTYDPQSIDYANLVSFGQDHANAALVAPLQWLCLPTPSPNTPTSAFSGAKLDCLTNWASLLDETAKFRVLNMIEVTNVYQEHLLALHPIGVRLRKTGVLLVLPRSLQEASSPSSSFWLPPNFFLPPGIAVIQGMMYFFETFQDEMRKGSTILHSPSKTFYSRPTGIVCMTHPLIQIYINCLAIQGNFQPPEPAPAGYDLSQFNVSEHNRIVSWMSKWITAIKQHTQILANTYPERKMGLSLQSVRLTSADSEGEFSDDFDAGSEPDDTPATPPLPSSPIPSTSTANPSVPGPSKRSKGKQPMQTRSFANYDDSDKNLVQDYKAID